MNLISVIKVLRFLVCFVVFTSGTIAQNTSIFLETEAKDTVASKTYQKSLIYSAEFVKPFTTESSFIGKGTTAKPSYNLGIQMFIYKNFFVGGFTGTTYLDVTNKQFTGNYVRSVVAHSYLNLGYELPINDAFRIGASATVLGSARYRNRVNNSGSAQQLDHAKLNKYGVYLSYKIDGALSIFAGYSYRIDKTEINVAAEIQDNFNRINYHSISFGIKIYGGNKDAISAIADSYKKD